MDNLLYPMFSRLTKVEDKNPRDDEMFDTFFLKTTNFKTRTDEFEEFEPMEDVNIWKFLPGLPKTCKTQDPIPIEDWHYFFPMANGTYNVRHHESGGLCCDFTVKRIFGIDYPCDDCGGYHSLTSNDCYTETTYKMDADIVDHKLLESFPDELAYACDPKELLKDKLSWRIENDLIRMIEEDLEQEKERMSQKRVTEEDIVMSEEPEDERWFETDPFDVLYRYLFYIVRHLTLPEHLEMFYGKSSNKYDHDFKDTLMGQLMKDNATQDAADALIENLYC